MKSRRALVVVGVIVVIPYVALCCREVTAAYRAGCIKAKCLDVCPLNNIIGSPDACNSSTPCVAGNTNFPTGSVSTAVCNGAYITVTNANQKNILMCAPDPTGEQQLCADDWGPPKTCLIMVYCYCIEGFPNDHCTLTKKPVVFIDNDDCSLSNN